MSIEIILIPAAVAAIAAWQANRGTDEAGRTRVAVTTRLRSADLLRLALRDLGATVDASSEEVVASWSTIQASFSRDESGVWTAHFEGDVTTEEATDVIQNLDRAYGRRVQQEVLERLRDRAPQAGMTIESETVEEDRTVTLILNVGR